MTVPTVRVSPGQYSPASAVDAANPTLSDTVDDPAGIARGILVAATGNVSFVTIGGTTVSLLALPANVILPMSARRIRVTGTTVAYTDLYLLY